MKYRKIAPIEAYRWMTNGDHPEDGPRREEGKVVRYYRHPSLNGQDICPQCINRMHDHGWIDTREGGHIVCPGDFIAKGVEGEFWPIKPSIFYATYEPVPE